MLTEQEKHFVRYLLKVSNAFEAVLNHMPMKLPPTFEQQYQMFSEGVNIKKVENYLRRQVRKRQVKLRQRPHRAVAGLLCGYVYISS